MAIFGHKPTTSMTEGKPGIRLAFLIAIGFHAVLLLLPVTDKTSKPERTASQIEVQLTAFNLPAHEPPEELVLPDPIPEPVPESTPEPSKHLVESTPEVETIEIKPMPATPLLQPRQLKRDLATMGEAEKARLTTSILARQFITDESAANRIFGQPLNQQATELAKEFHYPVRPDLLTMLDQPMQDLPFEYTPDLVYFAYDPGVRGDLQRFRDLLMVEFGWRTRYGTEVRCVWFLIVAGCGWK